MSPVLTCRYISDDSRTLTGSQRALSATAIYPTAEGAIDVLQLKGNLVTERIADGREDSYDRVIGLISDVDDITVLGQQTRSAKLPDGVSGFFGLGVYKASSHFFSVMILTDWTGQQAMVYHAQSPASRRPRSTRWSQQLCRGIRYGEIQPEHRRQSWESAFWRSSIWLIYW
jgi:hypothetical protein